MRFPRRRTTARDGAVLKASQAWMSMLTAPSRTSKFLKITPCKVEAAGSARFADWSSAFNDALPNSLYHIINLATRREETNAEAEAAQYRRRRGERHPHARRVPL